MKTCFMEGGILAVIENSVQAEEIKKIVETKESYFVGVRRLLPRGDFYTIKGKVQLLFFILTIIIKLGKRLSIEKQRWLAWERRFLCLAVEQ